MSLKIGPDGQHQDILAKQSERHTGRKNRKKITNKPVWVSRQKSQITYMENIRLLTISVKICKIKACCLVTKLCPTVLQPHRL